MKGIVPFNRRNASIFGSGRDDFYNALDDFFGGSWLPGRNLTWDTFKIDIEETDQEYCIEAELPGIQKEEVNLHLEDGRLTVAISRTEKVEENKKNYVHQERCYGSMSRTSTWPMPIRRVSKPNWTMAFYQSR